MMNRALRWFVSWYGSGPLHLLVLIGCFGLAAFAGVRLWGAQPVGVTIWLLVAVVGHDLVLFPLYTLADRSARDVLRHRRPPSSAAVPWINHVRVPVVISLVLLMVYFPVILRLSPFFESVTSYTMEVYVARYAGIVGALFLGSGVLYALRLRRHGRAGQVTGSG